MENQKLLENLLILSFTQFFAENSISLKENSPENFLKFFLRNSIYWNAYKIYRRNHKNFPRS